MGAAVLAIERSMAGVPVPLTIVVTLAVLFARLLSVWFPETEAVFVIDPAAVGVTTTLIVSVAPAASAPIRSVNTPAAGVRLVPVVVSVAETKVAFAGKRSVMVTPVAPLT